VINWPSFCLGAGAMLAVWALTSMTIWRARYRRLKRREPLVLEEAS
jgi:hypothetical protein